MIDIQIRKQLEQLEYIKDKLEYIEYDEALGCYIEKQDGLPTGVAAWVNGAFYGFEQAAKAQAVPECTWMKNEDGYFDASCGQSFVFSEPEDKPSVHEFTHCCFCGGKLIEAQEPAND